MLNSPSLCFLSACQQRRTTAIGNPRSKLRLRLGPCLWQNLWNPLFRLLRIQYPKSTDAFSFLLFQCTLFHPFLRGLAVWRPPALFQAHQARILALLGLCKGQSTSKHVWFKFRILDRLKWFVFFDLESRKEYLRQDSISDLCFGGKLSEIPHDIGNFLFLDEVLLLVVEEGEAFVDFGFEVLFPFDFFGHGEVIVPKHVGYRIVKNQIYVSFFIERIYNTITISCLSRRQIPPCGSSLSKTHKKKICRPGIRGSEYRNRTQCPPLISPQMPFCHRTGSARSCSNEFQTL